MRKIRYFFETYKYHLLIFLLTFFIVTRFKFDPDLGWHLAIGGYFLKTGHILGRDIFSWTLPGYRWGNYFLYDVMVSFVFTKIGFFATAILFGIVSAISVVLVLPRKISILQLTSVFPGILLLVANAGVRPSNISFLIFSVFLLAVSREFLRFKNIWFWVIFFAIWANLHTGFLAGLVIFGGYLGINYLWKSARGDKVSLFENFCLAAGAFLGTFISPFGFIAWKALILDIFGNKTWVGIAEWQSVFFYFPMNVIFATSGGIFVFCVYTRFKKIDARMVLLGAFIFAWSFLVVNAAFFWALFFIYFCSRNLIFAPKWELRLYAWHKVFIYVFSTIVIFLVPLAFILEVLAWRSLENGLKIDGYPIRALQFMAKNQMTERVFNDYSWGGFIDWYEPGIKVFIDGRMAGWRSGGSYLLSDYDQISKGRCQSMSKYGVRNVLVSKKFSEKCFLGFRKVYSDDVAKVFVRAE